ncbi:TIM21-like protein [Mya arenaria]|uniref:Mitochondrial import inner membrane translocase subunit Tim21 n=1 Tax=Mya arenaria TaxID=6604 RepID=A0ABY7ESQ7_MYAAR|nr:TIM21-like protein [Mya arenaria]
MKSSEDKGNHSDGIQLGYTSSKDGPAQNQKPPEDASKTGTQIDIKRKNPYADMTTGRKVKEAGKDFTYLGISVAAIGVLGYMLYYIGFELFGGDSVNSIYTKATKRCSNDPEVQVALGQPIRAFGEETRRGRRRHVSHLVFHQDGKEHMRMTFHIQGSDKRADVNLEMVKDDSGHYVYRYLFLQMKEFPYRTIILEDNR